MCAVLIMESQALLFKTMFTALYIGGGGVHASRCVYVCGCMHVCACDGVHAKLAYIHMTPNLPGCTVVWLLRATESGYCFHSGVV